jgi:hypothetical protein
VSRLICLDLKPGRIVIIRGARHRITHVEDGGPRLTLKPERENARAIKLSRNELATLLVLEEAELFDELEDPDADPVQDVIDLSRLSVPRIVDWVGKVFLLRKMMPRMGSSYKSAEFKKAHETAVLELNGLFASMRIKDFKTWSCLTIYHDLRRWRSLKYSLAAIYRKGVEYCPWQTDNRFYVEARKFIEEEAREHPSLSVASIHDRVNKRLKTSMSQLNP